MTKQRIFWFVFIVAASSCQVQDKQKKASSVSIKADTTKQIVQHSMLLSDSALLQKHLDSLPILTFPYHSEFHNRDFPQIDLSEFLNKKLTQLPFKQIPTVIGGGAFDQREEDSTFNLVNEN